MKIINSDTIAWEIGDTVYAVSEDGQHICRKCKVISLEFFQNIKEYPIYVGLKDITTNEEVTTPCTSTFHMCKVFLTPEEAEQDYEDIWQKKTSRNF